MVLCENRLRCGSSGISFQSKRLTTTSKTGILRIMEIKRAVNVGVDIHEKISEIFVDGFGKDLRFFSKDKNKLAKALAHIFVVDYFYVAVIDDEVAGITACVDRDHFCVNPDRKTLVKHLGIVKGFLAASSFKRYFQHYPKYPVDMDSTTASVEFVAVSSKHRKKGVASAILTHLHSLPEYKDYILEVADTNTNAFELYKRLGYKEVVRKKLKLEKLFSKVNYFVYMKYSK